MCKIRYRYYSKEIESCVTLRGSGPNVKILRASKAITLFLVVDTVHSWSLLEATTTTSPSKAGITGMSGEV